LSRNSILDIGGRRSPYTIGLPAEITVLELPTPTPLQAELHFGLTGDSLERLRRRRTNIRDVVLEDMTRCPLP
jgi:hypothetical protein